MSTKNKGLFGVEEVFVGLKLGMGEMGKERYHVLRGQKHEGSSVTARTCTPYLRIFRNILDVWSSMDGKVMNPQAQHAPSIKGEKGNDRGVIVASNQVLLKDKCDVSYVSILKFSSRLI